MAASNLRDDPVKLVCTQYQVLCACRAPSLRPHCNIWLQAAEKKWTAVEQTVHVRARAFHRYLPDNESEVLAAGLLQESRLRARLQVGSR